MTKEEAKIVTAYTGFLIGDFSEFPKYAEELLGCPIFTHEFADKKVCNEIHEKAIHNFLDIKIED